MDSKLELIYRQIPNSDISCPPNCGACCGILWPSLAEIRNIKDYLNKQNREYIEFNMTTGLNCPYLSYNKRCSIYPVRPFLCRILASSTELPCPLKHCICSKPLNRAQSSKLYNEIYLKGKQKPLTEKHRRLLKPILEEYLI